MRFVKTGYPDAVFRLRLLSDHPDSNERAIEHTALFRGFSDERPR